MRDLPRAALAAAALSLPVLALALGTLVDANGSPVLIAAASAWAAVGPHLVLASLAALALALPLLAKGRRPARVAVAALAVAALLASAGITSAIVAAAHDAGGSANPLAALVPLRARPAAPDAEATYKAVDGLELRALVHKPAGPGPAPVLLYLHGGGWVGGSAAGSGHLARWYAQQGWLVVSADYRLATPGHPTWDEAPADAACALAWTAAHAREWGGDPARLTVMGDSAGGTLALTLAWSAALGAAPSECPTPGPVPVPGAVVAGVPVADLRHAHAHGHGYVGSHHPRALVEAFLGGSPEEHPDRLAAASPLTYASAAAPPTLVVAAGRDDFIPVAGTEAAVEAARRAGVDATLARIPFAHHAIDRVQGGLGDLAKRSIVVHFLAERGLAP